jgi:hypothetical protein
MILQPAQIPERLLEAIDQAAEQKVASRTNIIEDILWEQLYPDEPQNCDVYERLHSIHGHRTAQIIREALWEYFFPDEPYPAKKPNISPEISKKPEKITLMDIQAACKRAKGQVRAFEPKPIETKVRR